MLGRIGLLLLVPFVVAFEGLLILWQQWQRYRAQRHRHGVLPDPTITILACCGMALFLIGYCMMVLDFLRMR